MRLLIPALIAAGMSLAACHPDNRQAPADAPADGTTAASRSVSAPVVTTNPGGEVAPTPQDANAASAAVAAQAASLPSSAGR